MTAPSLFASLTEAAAHAARAQPYANESARPLVHVLLAYGFAWLAILGWTWRIARLRRQRRDSPAQPSADPRNGNDIDAGSGYI